VSTYQTSTSGVGRAGKAAEGLRASKTAWLVNADERERSRQSHLVQQAKQLKVCAAGKAAQLVNAVAYVAVRECTRQSRLVYWLVQQAKQLKELCSRQMRVQVWERKLFMTAGYNQRFIYSVSAIHLFRGL